MCRKYKFKVKTKKSRFDRFKHRLYRKIKKRVEIININDHPLPGKCIMIGNHFGASGPFNYKAFVPHQFMMWGAHQMCEGFLSRRRYMYHTFYRQKLGYGKFKSFILSVITGLFTGTLYRTAGIIPIYYDHRLQKTFKYSFECLDKDVSIMIFPEDSTEGYKDKIEKFFSGFLMLTKLYYKRFKIDLPMYTLRYEKEPSKIVVGKPLYYQELAKEHTDEEITQIFIDYLNELKNVICPPQETETIAEASGEIVHADFSRADTETEVEILNEVAAAVDTEVEN